MTDEKFPCPFCNGKFEVLEAAAAVIHSIPVCLSYMNAADSLDFLRKVNENIRENELKS